MLDTYIKQLITAEYGDDFERAYDFSDVYDDFHTSLNFYRVYNKNGEIIIIRMSGKNILSTDTNVISEVLNESEYRPLTAEERQIYDEQQFGNKVR